jgi:hypothetical protein
MKKVFPKKNYYVLQYPNGKYVSTPGKDGHIWSDIPAMWIFDLKIYYKKSDAISDKKGIRAYRDCKVMKLNILVEE